MTDIRASSADVFARPLDPPPAAGRGRRGLNRRCERRSPLPSPGEGTGERAATLAAQRLHNSIDKMALAAGNLVGDAQDRPTGGTKSCIAFSVIQLDPVEPMDGAINFDCQSSGTDREIDGQPCNGMLAPDRKVLVTQLPKDGPSLSLRQGCRLAQASRTSDAGWAFHSSIVTRIVFQSNTAALIPGPYPDAGRRGRAKQRSVFEELAHD